MDNQEIVKAFDLVNQALELLQKQISNHQKVLQLLVDAKDKHNG